MRNPTARSKTTRALAPTLALLTGLALVQGCSNDAADEAATPPVEDTTQMPAEPAATDPAATPSTDTMPTEPVPADGTPSNGMTSDPMQNPATPVDPTLPPPADGTNTGDMSDQPQPAEPATPPTDR